MIHETIQKLLCIILILVSLHCSEKPRVASRYIHFRSDENTSGAGGILEINRESVKFTRDSIIFTCKRIGNKIWMDDSVLAEIIFEYPDSLRLLLGNSYYHYRALRKFSGNPEEFLNKLTNTWSFVSDDYSFALVPENKPSYVLGGASIYSRVELSQSNDVVNFHLKTILHEKSLILFGFDIHNAYTTIQFFERKQDTIRCELYYNGMAIQGSLIKHANISQNEMDAVRTILISKKWVATWRYQKIEPIKGEIQLIGENSSYIESKSIQNGAVSIIFEEDGKFHYNRDKSEELGNWRISTEGDYLLLENEEGFETSLIISKSDEGQISLVRMENIKHLQEFLFGERILFR